MRVAWIVVALAPIFTGDASVVGPPNGSLIAFGGGHLGAEVTEEFIRLAGGHESDFVIIPTAAGDPVSNARVSFLARDGCKNVRLLHTDDRTVADSDSFAKQLRSARGVWLAGGRSWRLVDTYLDTRTQRELEHVLQRGGVIGGDSAGASMMASYLVRGSRAGNQVVMAPGYETGFGFLRGVAIDQHLGTRHRENDLISVINIHPELLGIGLDEGTAIVVQRDSMRVVGEGRVLVYDPKSTAGSRPYMTLRPGDAFDLAARKLLVRK